MIFIEIPEMKHRNAGLDNLHIDVLGCDAIALQNFFVNLSSRNARALEKLFHCLMRKYNESVPINFQQIPTSLLERKFKVIAEIFFEITPRLLVMVYRNRVVDFFEC